MSDAKTVIEKFTDAVKGAANSIADSASNAVGSVIKSNADRFSPDIEQVAGSASEQNLVPEATDAGAGAILVPVSDPANRPSRKRKVSAKAAPPKIPNKPATRPKKSKTATKTKIAAKTKAAAKKGKTIASKTAKKKKKSRR